MGRGALKGGLNFEGRASRSLFATKPLPRYETVDQQCFFSWLGSTARLYPEDSRMRETLSWIHSVPNGAHTSKGHAKRLIAEGLTAGILDISCDEPCGEWHGLRIEMKRKGGRISPEQKAYMSYLDRVKIRRAVCYSWTEAARLLIEYLGLTTFSPISD